jgi:antigen flippase
MATQTPQTATEPKRTYGQILKSSALVGGSSVANIVIGIARAKVMAVLLGPAGVGLTGLYSSVLDVTSTLAGMGVNSSGVREIAAAVGSGDTEVIARTTVVLRRISILLGALGTALLIAFSSQVSSLTFSSDKYAGAICLLSIAVFFRLVSAGQGTLIQGMRRISDLAKIGLWSAFFGALITIVVVFLFHEKGIVPSIICGAAVSMLISWRYSRTIRIRTPRMVASEAGRHVAALLKLGVAFMITSLMTIASAYAIRIIILRSVGLEGAGLYQSAWTLGGLYVGIILQAMSADFYPRLTASANDDATCNRLVNEQALIGLLLGGPGVLGTLALAPLVITIFYTAKFHAAAEILRWFCLATILQVISWPMGFISLAKGRQHVFLLSDAAWTVVYICLAWIGVRAFGLKGAGIAFFGSYVFHLVMTYPIARHLSGFRLSSENKRTAFLFLSLIAFVFCGFYLLPLVWATSLGILASVLSAGYSIWVLINLVSFTQVPTPIRHLVVGFGLAPSDSAVVK